MKDRDSSLQKIRPQLSINNSNKAPEEDFQNKTLRPILKLQNDLLVEVFRNYLTKHKIDFSNLAPEKQVTFIANAIQKDTKLRNSLKGMIIGHFTIGEYQYYISRSSEINKRMNQLIIQRLEGNIQLFVTPSVDANHL